MLTGSRADDVVVGAAVFVAAATLPVALSLQDALDAQMRNPDLRATFRDLLFGS